MIPDKACIGMGDVLFIRTLSTQADKNYNLISAFHSNTLINCLQ